MAGGSHDSTVRAILYAFLANFGIAIAKTWASVVTGSGSMLAEAIHSYADTGNQVLLYLGLKQSQKPPDEEHPLGYGKLSYFWSFIVAILLFSMGGLFSIYEGYHKLTHPEPLSQIWIAIVVLVLAILHLFVALLVGGLCVPVMLERSPPVEGDTHRQRRRISRRGAIWFGIWSVVLGLIALAGIAFDLPSEGPWFIAFAFAPCLYLIPLIQWFRWDRKARDHDA